MSAEIPEGAASSAYRDLENAEAHPGPARLAMSADADLEKLIGRLLNWKFDSAAQMLSASDTTEAACVIRALAAQFGNCGHIDGQMGELIGSVVDLLLRNLKPTSKPE